MEQGKFWYDKEDMRRNGRACGYVGFAFGTLFGVIATFMGLWALAEYLGIK